MRAFAGKMLYTVAVLSIGHALATVFVGKAPSPFARVENCHATKHQCSMIARAIRREARDAERYMVAGATCFRRLARPMVHCPNPTWTVDRFNGGDLILVRQCGAQNLWMSDGCALAWRKKR